MSDDEDTVINGEYSPSTINARLLNSKRVKPHFALNPDLLVANTDTLSISHRICNRFLNDQLHALNANGRFDTSLEDNPYKLWKAYVHKIAPAVSGFEGSSVTYEQFIDFLGLEYVKLIDFSTQKAHRFVSDPTILGHTYLHKTHMYPDGKVKGKISTSWRGVRKLNKFIRNLPKS